MAAERRDRPSRRLPRTAAPGQTFDPAGKDTDATKQQSWLTGSDGEEPTLAALAAAQGVSPIVDLDTLIADFWPADERADDIIAAVCAWRLDDE